MFPCGPSLKMDVLSLNLPGRGMCHWASAWTSRDCGFMVPIQVFLQRFLQIQRQSHHLQPFLGFSWCFPWQRAGWAWCSLQQCRGSPRELGILAIRGGWWDFIGVSVVSSAGLASENPLWHLGVLLVWIKPNPALPCPNKLSLESFRRSWSLPVWFLKQILFGWSHLGKIPAFSQPQNGVAGGLWVQEFVTWGTCNPSTGWHFHGTAGRSWRIQKRNLLLPAGSRIAECCA